MFEAFQRKSNTSCKELSSHPYIHGPIILDLDGSSRICFSLWDPYTMKGSIYHEAYGGCSESRAPEYLGLPETAT